MSNIKANFNMSNYLIFNFLFCSFVNDHYIFFNQVFNSITDTCLGVNYTYVFGSTTTYFQDKNTVRIALSVVCGCLLRHLRTPLPRIPAHADHGGQNWQYPLYKTFQPDPYLPARGADLRHRGESRRHFLLFLP